MEAKTNALKCITVSLLIAGCGEINESVPRGNWARTGETEQSAPKKISKTIKKVKYYHHTSPVVYGDLGFICTKGGITAFDADTAEPKWEVPLRADVISEPVISQDVMYALTRDNDLCVIDVKTGQLLWRDGVRSSTKPLAVSGDFILFGDDSGFYAVDKTTGELKWEYKASVSSAPTIHNQTVYFSTRDERYLHSICGLSIKSGKEVFRCEIGKRGRCDFLPIYKNRIFFVAEEKLQALNLKNKKIQFIYDVESLQEHLCISDGIAYFTMGRTERVSLYAVDIKTKEVLWNRSISYYPWHLIISGKNLYVGERGGGSPYSGYGGTLLVLNKKTGKVVDSYETDDDGIFTPSFLNGKIYLGDGDNLYILK